MSGGQASRLASVMAAALASAGLETEQVADSVTEAVHRHARGLGLPDGLLSVAAPMHQVVVVSGPPEALAWLRLDVPGLAAAVRQAYPGGDDVVVRLRRADVR